MRVLIAEDDLASRKILTKMLEQWDYQVTAVADGEAAMEVFRSPDPPRFAMLDWEMPGLSGVEVCRELRRTETDVPTYVILLTMRTDEEDTIAGLEAGADDYVTKPFNREELRARLNVGRRIVELQDVLKSRIAELEIVNRKIESLRQIFPLCIYCHRICVGENEWRRLEKHIEKQTGMQFSGSICPACAESAYPGMLDQNDDEARSA